MARAAAASPPTRPRVQHWEFLLCDDGLEGPVAAIVDLLRLVNLVASTRGARREPLAWQRLTPSGRRVRSGGATAGATGGAGGTGRTAATPRPPAALPDVLVVPGWHARNGPHLNRIVARDRAACARLAAVHGAGGQVLALYTGVALAGEAGLLEGARAVVPWPFIPSVLRHAPRLELAAGAAFVEHARVWTVDSPTLATEAALAVLQATGLGLLAESVRGVLLHSPERQGLARAVAADARSRVGPGSLERARRWLEDHLHEPYSLGATARAAATSERSLLRHFRAAYGQTPLQMLHALRVTRAHAAGDHLPQRGGDRRALRLARPRDAARSVPPRHRAHAGGLPRALPASHRAPAVGARVALSGRRRPAAPRRAGGRDCRRCPRQPAPRRAGTAWARGGRGRSKR